VPIVTTNLRAPALVFYDRDGVRITRWFSAGGRRYPIDRLSNLRRARGPADRTARRAARTAAVSLPALLTAGPRLPLPLTLAMAVILVGWPSAVAAVRTRWRPASFQLWADEDGRAVRLYETRDATEFGRISRALLRAAAR
jgi:hypothetical protein